mmetsp:Transcript_15983/g.22005  ORF Transcript_15983/g.22005 Transcript_15983/m.22005 type:complete len:204 (-) Transcript_15983:177-788(-)
MDDIYLTEHKRQLGCMASFSVALGEVLQARGQRELVDVDGRAAAARGDRIQRVRRAPRRAAKHVIIEDGAQRRSEVVRDPAGISQVLVGAQDARGGGLEQQVDQRAVGDEAHAPAPHAVHKHFPLVAVGAQQHRDRVCELLRRLEEGDGLGHVALARDLHHAPVGPQRHALHHRPPREEVTNIAGHLHGYLSGPNYFIYRFTL